MVARPLISAALVPVLAGLLAGCVSFGGGKAPDTLFTLTASRSAAAGAAVSGKAESALVVFDPDVDRALAVQRVAVSVDPANVAYLKNALWAERPSRLFGSLLAETLRAKGDRLVFEAAERGAIAGNTRLTGRLLAMGYDAATREVVVRYDAIRSDPDGTVSSRRFEHRVVVRKPDPERVAPALNDAANAVAGEVADWIG